MEDYPDRKIIVVDSLGASLGQGLLVYLAQEKKEQGEDLETVAKWAEENRLHMVHLFTVNDLNHLYRGGRISRTTAVVGSMLNIKPVLHVDNDGKLTAIGKVRGRKKSLQELVKLMDEKIGSYHDICHTIFISHGDCMDDVLYLEKLIEEFGKFQGVGRKGATRMAYQVLSMSDKDAAALADAIRGAHTRLHRCRICQNFTDADLCPVCASAKRDTSVICVVEKPRDVQAFERTREYNGLYHVLHGLLDPLAGVGAEQLTVKELLARLKDDTVKEVIMAMNPTVEGEATAMYLAKLIKPLGIRVTRLASGLPVGASLEYADETTLYRALSGRGEL